MNAYEKGELNSQLYSSWRTKFEDFFDSERYFFEKTDLVSNVESILDIGSASGGGEV